MKVRDEFLTHLTTLSTGSILVLATFAERFKDQGQARWLAVASVVGFFLCIALTLWAKFSIARLQEETDETTRGDLIRSLDVSTTLATPIFLMALLALASFVVASLA